MTGLIAALKRDPARHLAQNLLSPLNGTFQPLTVPADLTPFLWSTGLQVFLNLTPPPGEPYSVDILPDGKIKAFFQADVYLQYIEFDFDVNSVWSAGSIYWVCLKRVPVLGCIAGFPVIMPRIPPIRFHIDLKRFGIDHIALWSLNPSFAVNALETKERVDADHLQLYAKVAIFDVGVFPNPAGLAQAIANTVFQIVNETLAQIPILGQVLRYFAGFVEAIVDRILNGLHFADSLQNFILARVQQAVADLIGRF